MLHTLTTDTAVDVPARAAGTVGLLQGSALYIASVLGTGILVLPALAVTAAGPASILAVAAVLLLSIPLAGTFAALAARYPDAGGVATFVRLALGKTAARVAGVGASYIVDAFGGPLRVVIVVAALIFVPPFISNVYGLRMAGWVQLALTGALVVIVVGVVLVAAPESRAENFEPFLPSRCAGVGAAISLFVWAFAGWEAVTHIAGEFKNPRRTIPLATAIAIAAVGIAYLALQVVTVGVLGDAAGSSAVPLLDLVASGAPGVGPVAVAVIAAVVALGVLNLYLGAFAKLGASLGRDGDLPKWMAAGAEAGGIPRRSLAVVAVVIAMYLSALVVFELNLTPFILIHTSCMIAIYVLGMISAVRLLERWSVGWWLAVISVVLVAGLVVLAGWNLLVPLGLAGAALAVAAVRSWRRSALDVAA